MYSFIDPEMSHRATTGGGAIDRRAKLEVDRAAGLQRAAEAAARVDSDPPAAGREAPRPALVVGHHEPLDRLARLLDLGRAHLGEVLRAQDLGPGHREPGVEIDRRNRFGAVLRRLEQRVGDAARPGFRRLGLALARRPRRQHRDQLFEQALSLPEDAERLVEQQAVLVLLDEDRVQGGVEVLPIAEARRLDRGERVEHRARSERHAGFAQRAGEVDDVFASAPAGSARDRGLGFGMQRPSNQSRLSRFQCGRYPISSRRSSARVSSISTCAFAPSILAMSS